MKRLAISLAIVVLSLLVLVLAPIPSKQSKPKLGFTYSWYAADYLRIDIEAAFQAALDELKPDIIRIPLYWPRIETEPGIYDWTAYDKQIAMLEERGIMAVLAVGHKLPRWPECFLPAWLDQNDEIAMEERLNAYLTEVVNRYDYSPALYAWQVENEALFPFGDCPAWSPDKTRLTREIELVQSLDPQHPVYTTDSGELSLWWNSASLPIDGLGISVYREVYGNGRIMRWPVNAYYYKIRRALIRPFVDGFMISELQTEPWGARPVDQLSAEEIAASFTPQEIAERVDYASRLGADVVLAWGVEWWYYMREHGDPTYWQEAQNVFAP
jgi:hypothetical protein